MSIEDCPEIFMVCIWFIGNTVDLHDLINVWVSYITILLQLFEFKMCQYDFLNIMAVETPY